MLVRTYQEILDDQCFGLAAQLAFYFLLSLFPALLFLVALVSVLPIEAVLDQWFAAIEPFTPRDALALIRAQLEEIALGDRGGLLTVGLVGAIWSSSNAMMAITTTLNHAYDIEESRAWWKTRLRAIFLTIAFAVFLILASVLLLAGPPLLVWLGEWVGWSDAAVGAWRIARWPVILVFVVLAIDLIYFLAPNTDSEWVWITPGSLVATLLWVGASLGFRLYVRNFADFNATYGAIGGAILLLLWFYLLGLAILIGAELNAEIERELRQAPARDRHARPHDSRPPGTGPPAAPARSREER